MKASFGVPSVSWRPGRGSQTIMSERRSPGPGAVIMQQQSASGAPHLSSQIAADSRRPRARQGPLAGVRVADFCWMGVGACATRLLADFGAEVIRIEDRNRLDMPRRLPIYKGEARP